MYAIVDIDGRQYKVTKNDRLVVNRLNQNEGEQVELGKVKMLDEDGNVTLGNPDIEGVTVNAKVLEHKKGDKVTVFRKKRRKGYKRTQGHRQGLSRIEIQDIKK